MFKYLAILPLITLALLLILPETWLESYAWWDASSLNSSSGTMSVGGGSEAMRVKTWRNMGYWKVRRSVVFFPGSIVSATISVRLKLQSSWRPEL